VAKLTFLELKVPFILLNCTTFELRIIIDILEIEKTYSSY